MALREARRVSETHVSGHRAGRSYPSSNRKVLLMERKNASLEKGLEDNLTSAL